ncbi:ABC transporter substrate-binding protein [Asticcacaulis sp. ZE23SCel15]|uniref:ABC transporter substrate-binding protein n=1 Tax=Asticcacaulis sp. ZE23SCel15 TaxID=3059027 RepID=UPI00265DD09E|nr:ABC transporter substrate-binding protein [Asticcacaulis sp. ZE23SCel15]WKL58703.1 ABC transporter substrate-binding protein [Asticcacaulis sp. ZE23SCel15]
MWYARCPTLTALGLIANRGILQREFLRENINVISVRENSTPAVRQGHLDHTLPNLIREADAATALWAYGLNGRSRLLALGATYHSVSVVVPQKSPLRSLHDLKGVRLSVPREAGSFSPARVRALRAWETITAFAGSGPEAVEFTNVVSDHPSVPFGDIARREIEALLGGQTDAAILYGAKGIELARAAGLRELHRFSAADIRHDDRLSGLIELRAVTVDDPFLEAEPYVVTRLLRQLSQAHQWAEVFPKEALNQIAIEGKVSADLASEAYGDLFVEGAQIGLEAFRLKQLSNLEQWLKTRGFISSDLSVGDWLRPDIIQSLLPAPAAGTRHTVGTALSSV